MRILNLSLVAAALLAAGACGGNDDNDNPGGGDCAVKLTGAVTSNLTCTAAVGGYTTVTNQSAVTVVTSEASPALGLSIAFTGELHKGTYHSTDNGALGAIAVTQGNSTWLAAAGGSGSYTMEITSLSTITSTAQSKAYVIHGSIDAILASTPVGGATVTLHSTF